jgi:hypothetical protein
VFHTRFPPTDCPGPSTKRSATLRSRGR